MAQGDLKTGSPLTVASASTGASNVLSGSITVSVGDLIVVACAQQVANTTTAVTDNLGNTYTAQNAGSDPGNATGRAFYSIATAGGTLTSITTSATASANDYAATAAVFEGPYTAIDANPANGTTDTTSPFTCPATGTLSQAAETVIAWIAVNHGDSNAYSATSPNLLAGQASPSINIRSVLGYQTTSATTSVAPEFTCASNPTGQIVLGTMSFTFDVAGSTYTLDAAAASYTYSATAAGLEFDRQIVPEAATYTYTASAAGLEFDRQIVADSAAYTWSATDAALEYTPAGSTYDLAADSAAYLWSATDAALEYVRIYSLDADASAFVWTASDAGLEYSGAVQQQPTGGWSSLPRDFGRGQTAEARRRERERLGIEPAQQRAIDRAAVKIAPVVTQGGLVSPQAVIAAPAFDRLLTAIRPTEGEVMALAQAIIDRIVWMMAEQEEEEAVVRMMMEMD